MHPIIRQLETEFLRKVLPRFDIGDTIEVHVKITEGDKERIQLYTGIVISRKGSGSRATFTVRRIVQGEGVERVFPLHSPKVADIVVKKKGIVRRAKLYYLRGRVGKGTKVREKIGALLEGSGATSSPKPEAAVPAAPAKA
ncbi:MAG: 50S ribosomal protein L19 [Planctomycetes bacterium]|nr:50S ribosomal protein L19 [Planctomycetota bacterium]